MSAAPWLKEAQTNLATERILRAAGEAFLEIGVRRTTMAEIAKRAGCSRATLYRYFDNRRAVQLAFIDLRAREISGIIAARTRGLDEPVAHLTESILTALAEVRARPELMAWFAADQAGFTARLSAQPELIASLSQSLPSIHDDAEGLLRGSYVVRIIVSLLTMPGSGADEERRLVERYVVPSLIGPSARR